MKLSRKWSGTKPTRYVKPRHLTGDPLPAEPGGERRVFCKNYGACLNHALTAEWPGFHCLECASYDQEVMDPEEAVLDGSRCIDLLCALLDEDEGSRGNIGWRPAARRPRKAKIEGYEMDTA